MSQFNFMLVYIQKVLCWFTYKRQTQTECQKIHAEKEYWYQKKNTWLFER